MKHNNDYEFVSAAMDDEGLSEDMLEKLLADEEARQKWHEFHIIRDCMQRVRQDADTVRYSRESSVTVAASSATVQTVRTLQPAPVSDGRVQRKAANGMFGGFAVAASVLAVAVGVWQFMPPETAEGKGGMAEKAAPKDAQAEVVPVGGNAKAGEAGAADRSEPQSVVMPNAARNRQTEAMESKAVMVEKIKPADAEEAAR